MKILLVAPTYLPSRRANTVQVMKMAQAIQSLGHVVRVLVPDVGQGSPSNPEALIHHYGLQQPLDIHWLPVYSGFRGYDYGFKAVCHFRRWGAQLLYTRLPQAAAFASSLGIPTVFEAHDLPGGLLGSWLYLRFLRGVGARRLVVITQALREAISTQIAPLQDDLFTVVAPDGVDLSRYENLPSPLEARHILVEQGLTSLPEQTFTAGYTGHFYPGRGVNLILEIASRLPEISFLLVGGEPQAVQALKSEVLQCELKNIFLTGFVANTNLPMYQAACDALLMPYQRKVAASSGGDIAPYLSPMKLFEYMACGRVILSSDLPVLREVLNDRNALLLPPSEVGAWVHALEDVKADLPRQRALQAQAREDSRLYSWEARAAKIFTDLAGNG